MVRLPMSARRAAFEKIETALGDSVRRVGGVGGADLGFRPDPGVDLWIPLKVQRPIDFRDLKYVSWSPHIERHLVLVHEDDQVGIALSTAGQSTKVYLHNVEMRKVACDALHTALTEHRQLCRSWEAVELMCPLHRKRQEKKALKTVAETSTVNKTIRRVFEEQGLGKHLTTIGGRCGANFAFFPDPAVDACLGIKCSTITKHKYPKITSYAIDRALPYLFIAVDDNRAVFACVQHTNQNFNAFFAKSEIGWVSLREIPQRLFSLCRDDTGCDGVRLVTKVDVMIASTPAVKFMGHNTQETEGQDLIENNLPPGLWTRTEEFCDADAVYSPLSARDLLPIQIKTSSVTKKTGGYRFTLNHRYDKMLVMCIHLPSKTIFAVPGALLPDKTFSGKLLGSTEDSNTDYIVRPEELACFLESLYDAVSTDKGDGSWPADCRHDISSIRMVTHEEANIPREENQRKAQEYANFRKTKLPGLRFAPPRVQNTPVDILLNGARIQDKLASNLSRVGSDGWRCTMFRDTRSRGNVPYCDTDFDFLWIHIDRDIFYFIDAKSLARHHILSSTFSQGRTGIAVYPFGCANDADLWTDAFKFSYKDNRIEARIQCILAQLEDPDCSEVPNATTCDQSCDNTHD